LLKRLAPSTRKYFQLWHEFGSVCADLVGTNHLGGRIGLNENDFEEPLAIFAPV